MPPDTTFAHTLRLGVLLLIGCDLGLVALRVATYQAFFVEPNALGYLTEPMIALVIYAVVIALLPALVARMPLLAPAFRIGSIVGLIAGALDVLSTALESLASAPQSVVSVVTLTAMFALFLLFGVAGFLGARRTRRFWTGVAAAWCCAMCAVLLVLTFGFLLSLTSLPTLAHDMLGDPDYLRSGWTDPRAFAIANTFDAAFTHLAEAPVIAGVLGAIASGAGWLTARRRSPEPAGMPRSDGARRENPR